MSGGTESERIAHCAAYVGQVGGWLSVPLSADEMQPGAILSVKYEYRRDALHIAEQLCRFRRSCDDREYGCVAAEETFEALPVVLKSGGILEQVDRDDFQPVRGMGEVEQFQMLENCVAGTRPTREDRHDDRPAAQPVGVYPATVDLLQPGEM